MVEQCREHTESVRHRHLYGDAAAAAAAATATSSPSCIRESQTSRPGSPSPPLQGLSIDPIVYVQSPSAA